MEIPVVTQPHLGRVKQQEYKSQYNFNTGLCLGKVVNVHHKTGTVDVQLVRNNNYISSSQDVEGRHAARIATVSAHYNGDSLTASGVVQPIQKGEMVIVAFLNNYKSEPVILGSVHRTWDSNETILTNKYPLDENDMGDLKEALKYLRVFPSQSYFKVDGIGSLEYSHPSGTFLSINAGIEQKELSDQEYTHNDLTEKNSYTGTTLSSASEETGFPVDVLFDVNTLGDSHSKMFFSKDGIIRLSRDPNDSTLSYEEITQDGALKLVRQNDSNKFGSKGDYTEILIDVDGTVKITYNHSGKTSTISLQGDSIQANYNNKTQMSLTESNASLQAVSSSASVSLSHSVGSSITLSPSGDINITAKGKIVLTEG